MNLQARAYVIAIAVSVLLHTVLIGVAVWGWESSAESVKRHTPRYIEAKLVELKPQSDKPKQAAKSKPRIIDLTAKKREQERLAAEKKRKLEQQRKAKAEQARKQKAERERKQAEAEAKRRAKQEADKRREAERLQQMQRELDAALEQEQEYLEAQTQAEVAQSYIAMIAQRIEQNWSRPPSARKGMQCKLRLHLVPTGEVVDVSVIEGSGNGAFDRSAELAVKRVGRFSELQGMDPQVFERYFRQLTLVFNPQDLRL